MTRGFINRFEVHDYRCLKDTRLELTPLHALIGPNDSGKSTILRAIGTICEVFKSQTTNAFSSLPGAPQFDAEVGAFRFSAIKLQPGSATYQLFENEASSTNRASVSAQLNGAVLLQLRPEAMRASSELIPDDVPLTFDMHGRGLASVYDALATREPEAFRKISDRLREFFPSVQRLQLRNPTKGEKALAIVIEGGTLVPAAEMSEGILYYLAYAALEFIAKPAVVLVEEPETGLHPSRIADVARILRDVSSHTQVIVATHSPLFVNELEPNEVSLVTRTDVAGTTTRLLKNTSNFEQRSKVYALGELWLSYADGTTEQELLGSTH